MSVTEVLQQELKEAEEKVARVRELLKEEELPQVPKSLSELPSANRWSVRALGKKLGLTISDDLGVYSNFKFARIPNPATSSYSHKKYNLAVYAAGGHSTGSILMGDYNPEEFIEQIAEAMGWTVRISK